MLMDTESVFTVCMPYKVLKDLYCVGYVEECGGKGELCSPTYAYMNELTYG